jgi:hypothetical protein
MMSCFGCLIRKVTYRSKPNTRTFIDTFKKFDVQNYLNSNLENPKEKKSLYSDRKNCELKGWARSYLGIVNETALKELHFKSDPIYVAYCWYTLTHDFLSVEKLESGFRNSLIHSSYLDRMKDWVDMIYGDSSKLNDDITNPLFTQRVILNCHAHPIRRSLGGRTSYVNAGLRYNRTFYAYAKIIDFATGEDARTMPGFIPSDSLLRSQSPPQVSKPLTCEDYYNEVCKKSSPLRYQYLGVKGANCTIKRVRNAINHALGHKPEYDIGAYPDFKRRYQLQVIFRDKSYHPSHQIVGEAGERLYHDNLGLVPLDSWEVAVAKGTPDYLQEAPDFDIN